tara:strand:+ start:202 stop:519 length:318 start_codon:yes stop_codon:yes gene_type:complete
MQHYTDLITLCDKVSIMAETWEDVTKDGTQPLKEWVVEYTVVVNEEKNQHLNIMYGEDLEDVQKTLLIELRKNYAENDRIDVTVQRMEEIKDTSNSVTFEGLFTP